MRAENENYKSEIAELREENAKVKERIAREIEKMKNGFNEERQNFTGLIQEMEV